MTAGGPGHSLRAVALTLALAAAAALALLAPGAAFAHGAPPGGAARAGTEWYFIWRGAHTRPAIPGTAARALARHDGLWIGAPRRKVVYLTFDAAAESGTTRRILTALDRAGVTATFFLTGGYMRANPATTRRIVAAGHLVGNHSFSHARMTSLTGSPAAFARQLVATARAYRRATGGRMARFFRPPYGAWSDASLRQAERLGYASVFWSFAYYDYDENAQPPASTAAARIIAAACPGVVYLLHAGSSANAAALPEVLRWLRRHGYRCGRLDELR